MEQELYRSRNVSKCVKAAYTLFNTNFKHIFKKLWLPFLVLSMLLAWNLKIYFQSLAFPYGELQPDAFTFVIYGVGGIMSLVAYVWVMANVFNLLNAQGIKANVVKLLKIMVVYLALVVLISIIMGIIVAGLLFYFKPEDTTQGLMNGAVLLKVLTICFLLMVVIVLLIIPIYYAFMQFMIEDGKLRSTFFPAVKTGFKHWGFLFVVLFVLGLIMSIFISVMMMPVFILTISQVSSMKSMAMGDPSGLPTYFSWLYFITFVVVYFITMFLVTWGIFVLYYAYGSIKRNEMDRELQKKELANNTSNYTT